MEFEIAGFAEGFASTDNYFLWHQPTKGDLVFDLGANCGLAAYRLSHMVGESGKVVCLEPDPVNFVILQRNISRHGLRNVTALQCAIGASCDRVTFASEGAVSSQMSKFLTRETCGETLTVDCLTLKSLCETYGTPKYVKVDIEGAEIEMLEAAQPVLKSHGIHFALDTQHKVKGRLTSRPVEELFRYADYETSTVNDGMFITTYARPKAPL